MREFETRLRRVWNLHDHGTSVCPSSDMRR